MREFFKGWRRTLGTVTLVLACVLLVGWVHSQSIRDEFLITDYGCGSRYFLRSHRGEIQDIEYNSLLREEQTSHRCSYALPTIPLTLLSAWLLLSRPRKPVAIPSDEIM